MSHGSAQHIAVIKMHLFQAMSRNGARDLFGKRDKEEKITKAKMCILHHHVQMLLSSSIIRERPLVVYLAVISSTLASAEICTQLPLNLPQCSFLLLLYSLSPQRSLRLVHLHSILFRCVH